MPQPTQPEMPENNADEPSNLALRMSVVRPIDLISYRRLHHGDRSMVRSRDKPHGNGNSPALSFYPRGTIVDVS